MIKVRESPKKLPPDMFLKSFEDVPRLAINLLAVDNQGRVLLTRRNIEPSKGFWHFPGSFLLKNELIVEAQKRIAKDELGLILKKSEMDLLGVFEDLEGDPRGHVVDIMYGLKLGDGIKVKMTTETLEIMFFDKLPDNIGFNHRETLKKLGYK